MGTSLFTTSNGCYSILYSISRWWTFPQRSQWANLPVFHLEGTGPSLHFDLNFDNFDKVPAPVDVGLWMGHQGWGAIWGPCGPVLSTAENASSVKGGTQHDRQLLFSTSSVESRSKGSSHLHYHPFRCSVDQLRIRNAPTTPPSPTPEILVPRLPPRGFQWPVGRRWERNSNAVVACREGKRCLASSR